MPDRFSGYASFGFRAYVPASSRRAAARREVAKRLARGESVLPVEIRGRRIATTFWGKGWCDHLERHGDFANRLPRGRTYVRNGSVVDLQITSGRVTALVSGSSLYEVNIAIAPLKPARWSAIVRECAGRVGSLVALLRGQISPAVLDVLLRPATGMFPRGGEFDFNCSCPDWARMCKHVAAALYGVGARLDHRPDLFFVLRGVDQADLIAATPATRIGRVRKSAGLVGSLADVFGIEIDESPRPAAAVARNAPASTRDAARRKAKPRGAPRTSAPKKWTNEVLAARKVQRTYLGRLRQLGPAEREKVKRVARNRGVVEAVRLADSLLRRARRRTTT